MSKFDPQATSSSEALAPPPTQVTWGALAAAAGALLWLAGRPSLGTLLKVGALAAGGTYAWRRYAPQVGRPAGAGNAATGSPTRDLEETRQAAEKLASAWGAHLSGAEKVEAPAASRATVS